MAGEFVRKNLVETQPGIQMTVDFQVLDVETCEPVSDVFLEIWSKFTGETTKIQGQSLLNDHCRLQLDRRLLGHSL